MHPDTHVCVSVDVCVCVCVPPRRRADLIRFVRTPGVHGAWDRHGHGDASLLPGEAGQPVPRKLQSCFWLVSSETNRNAK